MNLIKQGEDAGGLSLNQLQAAVVILVADKRPPQSLRDVFLLLGLQIVSYKVLLQLLISIVNAQLLQVVQQETLKAIHIQKAYKEHRWSLKTNAAHGPVQLYAT